MLPAFEGETLARRLSRFAMLVKWTPPVNAASVLAGASPAAPLFMLAAWCLALAAVLLRLERHPLTVRAQGKTRAEWDTLYDRVAAWFGPRYGPVAGKTLRYYLRSNRVRYNLFLAIPMLAFFSYTQARTAGPMALFASVLSAMAAVGFVGTAVMAVNQFGYDEGGFRRYFLLPAPAGDAFRASTFAALFLSPILVGVGILVGNRRGTAPA